MVRYEQDCEHGRHQGRSDESGRGGIAESRPGGGYVASRGLSVAPRVAPHTVPHACGGDGHIPPPGTLGALHQLRHELLGIPFRTGVPPEVTVATLHRRSVRALGEGRAA